MNPLVPPITERLTLRIFLDSDYEPFAAMSFHPKVAENLPPFPDRAACDKFGDWMRGGVFEKGWGFWVVERAEDGAFLGIAGLHIPGPEFGAPPCVEIGWRLHPDHWGNGYATEAAQGVLAFGFSKLELPEISSFTSIPNTRSIAVMERLGMTRQPETFEMLLFPEGHPHREHVIYAIARDDWQRRTSQA